MNNLKEHHYIETDYRLQSLRIILEGLEYSKKILSESSLISISYIDNSDIEFYYGIEYLAIQNYLKLTANDLKKVFNIPPKIAHYEIYNLNKEDKISNHKYSKIQLINACGDYFKHKEEIISEYVRTILKHFDLYSEEKRQDEEYYLLSEAYKYINPTYNIENLISYLRTWREKVWKKLEEDYGFL